MKIYQCILLVSILVLTACNQSNKPETNKTKAEPINQKVSSFVYGIDISKYQLNEIDSIYKQNDSLSFIICKSTEGITYTDPKFKSNWKLIREKGFTRGAYHFYISKDDPIAQAENYLSAIADLDHNDFPPIIDIEGGGIDKSQSIDTIQSTLLTFLEKIEKKLNRKPIIYTNVSIGNKYLNRAEFSNYPLWIASYGALKEPSIPNAWKNKNWLIWQKADNYEIGTMKNDFDVFNGNLKELKEFIKNSYNNE